MQNSMKIRFIRAFRWYKRGEERVVHKSVGKLWKMMGIVEECERTQPDVVETAEAPAPAVAESASMVPIPPLRRRRVQGHEVPISATAERP